MTTPNPQHARSGGLTRAWRGFRRWRRSRPFWGGLLTALAGVEIFATTKATLGPVSLQTPTGFLGWIIPLVLFACGLFLWFSPQQRMFYALVGAATALYSLSGVNFGGFFVGMLLGVVGASLGFAWVPPARPVDGPGAAGDAPDGGEPERAVDAPVALVAPRDGTGPALSGDLFSGRGRVGQRPTTADPGPVGPPSSHDPRLLAILLVLLGVSGGGLLAVGHPTPVQAAPACRPSTPAPTSVPPSAPASGRAAPERTAGPSASATPTPSASPSAGTERYGNLLTDLIEGIGDLLTGGGGDRAEPTTDPTPSPSVAPTVAPSGTASGTPGAPASRSPQPDGTPCASPTPSTSPEAEQGTPLPLIAADPGQPRVARTPSKLTGSKVTMDALRFAGVVELDTVAGPLKVLKFTMRRAVTTDFVLRTPGPEGRTMRYATDTLTVTDDVAFYATRFSGRLSLLGGPGLIRITLTPDLPLPDGVPITSPIPLTFRDPEIDLAFVAGDVLTAEPALTVTLT